MSDPRTRGVPDEKIATEIARRFIGSAPAAIRRFATGSGHYVYEALFPDRSPVVVRIGDRSARGEMTGARQLSDLLRPRGVPLPAILAADLEAALPWLVMERLAGTDLGAVAKGLADSQLDRIAAGIAAAQAAVATIGSAGRYGYSATPEAAPHERWSRVLEDNLDRAQKRIAAAGLFDPAPVELVLRALAAKRDAVDLVPATPFLHDTTTKNVIIAGDGTLSGIVDVDDLCFGDPRYAAALTLAALSGYGGPTQYVTMWLKHAHAEDDAVFRLYVAIFFLDLMGEHGHVFNGNQRPSVPEERASLLQAFEDNARRLGL